MHKNIVYEIAMKNSGTSKIIGTVSEYAVFIDTDEYKEVDGSPLVINESTDLLNDNSASAGY